MKKYDKSLEYIDSNEFNEILKKEEEEYFSDPHFNYYPSPEGCEAYGGKDKLVESAVYNLDSLSTQFATAYDDYSYLTANKNELIDNAERLKIIEGLTSAVESGADIEILKLKLAKALNSQKQEIDSVLQSQNPNKSEILRTYRAELQRTNQLIKSAEVLSKNWSPYEKLFKMSADIQMLKDRAKKLPDDQYDKYNKLQDKIADLQIELGTECAKFDPEMLESVAKHRVEYINESTKDLTKKQNNSNEIEINKRPANIELMGAKKLAVMAKRMVEKQNGVNV